MSACVAPSRGISHGEVLETSHPDLEALCLSASRTALAAGTPSIKEVLPSNCSVLASRAVTQIHRYWKLNVTLRRGTIQSSPGLLVF
jgi:hypothetical protein